MPSERSTRYVLAVLFAINTLNFFDRQVLSAVAEPIRLEWRLSDSALGALSTAFTLLYAFVGVPFGRLADTGRRVRLLAWGCLAWSSLTAACALAQSFPQMFLLRMGIGVGEASCAPAANALIGDLVPPERRARALSFFMLGLPLGLSLSYAVSGALAARFGWRAAFLVAGLPGVLLALAAFRLPEPRRDEAAAAAASSTSAGAISALLRNRTFLWLVASGAVHNFNMYAISTFLSPLLMRYHGLDVAAAGLVSTLIYGVAGGIGLFAGGVLSDAMAARRADGRLALTAVAIAASVPLTAYALGRERGDAASFALALGLAIVAMYVYYGSIYAALQDAVPRDVRATALALYFFAMYVLGASLGPFATGALSDRMTLRAAAAAGSASLEPFRAIGLRDALSCVPVLGCALVAILWAAARSVPARRESRSTEVSA